MQADGNRPSGGILGIGKVLVLKRLMAIPTAENNLNSVTRQFG